MAYPGQVNPNARKRTVKVLFSPTEYKVLEARADAHTQGNVSRYIREQLFGADIAPIEIRLTEAQAEELRVLQRKHKEHA